MWQEYVSANLWSDTAFTSYLLPRGEWEEGILVSWNVRIFQPAFWLESQWLWPVFRVDLAGINMCRDQCIFGDMISTKNVVSVCFSRETTHSNWLDSHGLVDNCIQIWKVLEILMLKTNITAIARIYAVQFLSQKSQSFRVLCQMDNSETSGVADSDNIVSLTLITFL